MRVEPFVNGFFASMKPQMTAQDRELLSLIFQAHRPFACSSADEKNPAKPTYYFRLGASHLNVMLPVWLLNGRTSSKNDRFRIACTEDHSVILDTKEKLIYDPTIEMIHMLDEYKPLRTDASWKDEAAKLFRDELAQKQIVVCTLLERIEHVPAIYESFTTFVAKHRLKNQVQGFRFGLDLKTRKKEIDEQGTKHRQLVEVVLAELWSRSQSKAA